MDSSNNPTQTLFGTDSPDLYQTLGLETTATSADIRTAYRKLALRYHPDKLLNNANTETNIKFQQIGYAYKILSDPKLRERWDRTGSAEESFLDDDDADWKEYFKELWSGEVSAQTIEEFTSKYQGSEKELKDLCEHYQTFEGDLPKILDHTLCATDADEPRLIKLIDQAIQDGTLTSNSRWKTTKSDKKARSKRSKAAAREAAEAEALAQELGVKKPTDGSEDSLRALIQAKSAGRHQSLVAKLEAKARAADQDQSQKKSKSKKKRAAEPDEPTDEEFQRIQAEMDARRTNAEGSSTSTKTSKPRKKTKS